jgi:PilZ domain
MIQMTGTGRDALFTYQDGTSKVQSALKLPGNSNYTSAKCSGAEPQMKSIFTSKNALLGNRRKFERVDVDYSSQVYVTDDKGKRAGIVRQIGRGGFMVEPEREFKDGKKYKLTIVDRSENIKLQVKAIVRYSDLRRVGFEFEDLSVESAVEIGILIGKYYQTDSVIL